jgi:hypothetical protein
MNEKDIARLGPHRGGGYSNIGKIFTVQKKIVRIMAGAQPRAPCRSMFKQLETPPVAYLYILSLVDFIIDDQEIFRTNPSIYNINTKNEHHLDRPNANPSYFQKGTFYTGIKLFNNLPPSVTILKNDKAKFRAALSKYLHRHCFYCVDGLLMGKDDL